MARVLGVGDGLTDQRINELMDEHDHEHEYYYDLRAPNERVRNRNEFSVPPALEPVIVIRTRGRARARLFNSLIR